jgi:hypothetical protein
MTSLKLILLLLSYYSSLFFFLFLLFLFFFSFFLLMFFLYKCVRRFFLFTCSLRSYYSKVAAGIGKLPEGYLTVVGTRRPRPFNPSLSLLSFGDLLDGVDRWDSMSVVREISIDRLSGRFLRCFHEIAWKVPVQADPGLGETDSSSSSPFFFSS